MKLYTVTIIHVSVIDEVQHNTKVFLDKNKAKEYLLKQEKKWKNTIIKNYIMTKQEFENWIEEATKTNFEQYGVICKQYVYEDGEEIVFELLEHDIIIDEKLL